MVERLQSALLQAMRMPDYEARYQWLEPVIEQTHDLDRIARAALGRTLWRRLSEAQRDRYLDLFRRVSISTYAREFSGHDGERFEIVSLQPMRGKDALVRTRLLRPHGTAVQLDYHLKKRNDRWSIVNVLSDGVSDLALKRDEYGTIVRDRGIDALLSELEAQSRPPVSQPRP